MHRALHALTAAAFLLALACSREGSRSPSFAAWDSAGITLAENAGSLPAGGGRWPVSPEPELTIGALHGDSLYQLYRVQGAALLSDGRIVAALGASGQLRVYSREGALLHSLGRKGEGPGEFNSPVLAGVLPGDTLVVVDPMLRRISLVHPEEGVVSSYRVSEEVGGSVIPQGLLGDRTVLVGGGFFFSPASGGQLSSGFKRPPTTFRSIHLNGTPATDFGEFPGSEFYMQVRSVGGGMAMSARLVPFGKRPMAAVSGTRFFFASGDRFEVRVHEASGRLERLIRWDRPPVLVTAGELAAALEEEEARAPDANAAREIRERFREMPAPSVMPALGALHADPLGFLWVEEYRKPGEEATSFVLFDPQGRMVGWAALPVVLEVLEIGRHHLLGIYRDELEVEYLRVYRFTRPGAGS